jgi:hypothetical protein
MKNAMAGGQEMNSPKEHIIENTVNSADTRNRKSSCQFLVYGGTVAEFDINSFFKDPWNDDEGKVC